MKRDERELKSSIKSRRNAQHLFLVPTKVNKLLRYLLDIYDRVITNFSLIFLIYRLNASTTPCGVQALQLYRLILLKPTFVKNVS